MEEKPRQLTLKDLLFMPCGCLLTVPPVIIFGLLGVIAVIGFLFYSNSNTDFFGLWAPDLASYKFTDQNRSIQDSKNDVWKITYEFPKDSTFSGKVSSVTTNHEDLFPFLTHDILITTGDFTDPSKVTTSVAFHHFTWVSSLQQPQGSIHFLHAVPLDKNIYQAMLSLKDGQQVTISGTEIYKIDAYEPDGKLRAWWTDDGCNSILIKSVTIQNK
jgi:hypothetical protein